MTAPELCPKCGSASKVVEVRKDGKFNGERWRKRRCLKQKCWQEWVTEEVVIHVIENNIAPQAGLEG